SISRATAAAPSLSTSATNRALGLSDANRRQSARPIPLAPPVTTMTLSRISMTMVPSRPLSYCSTRRGRSPGSGSAADQSLFPRLLAVGRCQRAAHLICISSVQALPQHRGELHPGHLLISGFAPPPTHGPIRNHRSHPPRRALGWPGQSPSAPYSVQRPLSLQSRPWPPCSRPYPS